MQNIKIYYRPYNMQKSVLNLMCVHLMWSSKIRNYGIWLTILNLQDVSKNR